MWPLFVCGDTIETSSPECTGDVSAYLRATIESGEPAERTMQLTFCGFFAVWLNGEKLATFDHGDELYAENVTLHMQKGRNDLLVKTAHNDFRRNSQRDLWVFHAKLLDM